MSELWPLRRRAERVRPGPLVVDLPDGPAGTLVDISELGALLELPAPNPPNSLMSFQVHFAHGVVRLHGRVVRCSPRYDRLSRVSWSDAASYHVAVEFVDLASQSTSNLRDLLRPASPTPGQTS
jgi:hypothetical protein